MSKKFDLDPLIQQLFVIFKNKIDSLLSHLLLSQSFSCYNSMIMAFRKKL